MNLTKTIAVLACLSATVSAVKATQINGEISLSGTYTINGTNFKPYDPILNPLGATAFTGFSSVEVESAAGDYAGTVGDVVTHNAFSFTPFSGPITLWTFTDGGTTYSFTLNDLDVDYRATKSLVLSGTGFASITGFDSTPGDWTFTANTGGGTFSFSSTNSVPDGGATAMLLGVGLLGIGAMRRKMS